MVIHAKVRDAECTGCGKVYTFETMAADTSHALDIYRMETAAKYPRTRCPECVAADKAAIVSAGSGI